MLENLLSQFLLLTEQMAPYLLLGFMVAGLLHVFVPRRWVFRQLGRRSAWAVIKGALLGAPLPLCSCGVLPVAASLRKSGASPPAVLSFLIATPVTGVDSVLATYALMGGFLATVRPVASVVLAIAAGLVLLLSGKSGEEAGTSQETPQETAAPPSLPSRLVAAVRYAFVDLFRGIAGSMLLGLAAGAAIAAFVPADLVTRLGVGGVLSYLLMVAIGVPLYVCATGSIPIAAALLAKGLSPGAALAFLLAGPATNTVAIAVSRTLVGRRGTLVYLACIVVGSVLAAAGTDALAVLVGYSWEAATLHHHHAQEGPGLLFRLSGFALLGLAAWHITAPRVTAWRLKRRSARGSQVDGDG
ncbi:MAG: permease [Deltaproteobacteria bacterium]|nr:permease [Deltaproteobacteria bacterium]